MNRTLILLIFLLPFSFLNAQSRGAWQVGAYTSALSFEATANNGNYIRVINTEGASIIKANAYQWSLGSSVERMLNKTLFVSSGLYFSQFQTTTFDKGGINHLDFYALVNENESQVEYASIDRIYTVRSYLGIPLEVRYEPFHTRNVAFFVKGSIVTQFAIGKSLTDIRMSDNSIYNGSSSLPKHYENNRDVFFSGNATMGLRIGRLENINGRIEFGVPVPFSPSLGAYALRSGVMVSGTLYYPLGKK